MTTQEEIFKRLDALADKLHVASGELWRIVLRQARVEVASDLLWILVSIILIVLSYRRVRWAINKICSRQDRYNWPDDATLWLWPAALTTIVFTIVLVVNISEIWTPLLNPEFYALDTILRAIRP